MVITDIKYSLIIQIIRLDNHNGMMSALGKESMSTSILCGNRLNKESVLLSTDRISLHVRRGYTNTIIKKTAIYKGIHHYKE